MKRAVVGRTARLVVEAALRGDDDTHYELPFDIIKVVQALRETEPQVSGASGQDVSNNAHQGYFCSKAIIASLPDSKNQVTWVDACF